MPFSVSRTGHRAVLSAILVAALACALVLVASPQVAQADEVEVQPGELVVNGGAEEAPSVGWTGGLLRASHGVSGYPASVIVDENGLTGDTYDGGLALFTGQGGASVATQTVDLTPSAAAIDNGNVDALVSAFIGGYANQADNAQVSFSFRDALDNEVELALFGPVLPQDRGLFSGFVPFAESVRLPEGTRSAVITITTLRFVAPANDGYVDNVSLILDAPSPAPVEDTATTTRDVPVTINVAENDAPGTGAQIVPSSVRLLDDGVEVTTLTIAEGTYEVDLATGDVLFTPTPGFVGTVPPVGYRITDTSGQTGDSTISLEVTFVAAPGLSVVKSASPNGPEDLVVGEEITYSFVVTNTGNVPVSGIEVSEDAFTGAGATPVVTCPADSLEPEQQLTCTASYTLVQGDIDNGGVSNTASVSGVPEGESARITSDPSTAEVAVAADPALTVTKSADVTGASAAGDEIRYSYEVTNTGNVTLAGLEIDEVSFTGSGEIPQAVCPVLELLPSATTTCAADYELTQADVDAGTISNTAVARAPQGGEAVSSAPSVATATIDPAVSFTFAKTSTTEAITGAGQTVEYLFEVANTGNVTLTDVVIDDSDFSGAGDLGDIVCPVSSIAPGTTLQCSAQYVVVDADLGTTALTNTASAQVSAGELIVASDVSTATITVDAPEPEEQASGESPEAEELSATGVSPSWPLLAGVLAAMGIGGALIRRHYLAD